MANKKLTIHEQAQLLVQNILSKNTLSANEIFKKLIAESQQVRQNEIRKLILEQDELDDETDDLDETDEFGDEDTTDEEGGDQEVTDDSEGEADDSMSDTEVTQTVDDALEIQCQINAKRITQMFDTIAELKKALEGKDLDPNTKEYIKSDVSIAYYSDKLQEFQGKTNPGVDQNKLEEAIDKIFEALEQLKSDLGVESSDIDTEIETPEEVGEGEPEGESEQVEETESEEIQEEEPTEEGQEEFEWEAEEGQTQEASEEEI